MQCSMVYMFPPALSFRALMIASANCFVRSWCRCVFQMFGTVFGWLGLIGDRVQVFRQSWPGVFVHFILPEIFFGI